MENRHDHHSAHQHVDHVEKKKPVPETHHSAAPPTTQASPDLHAHHDMYPPMGHKGHDHHTTMIGDFKKRFWVSLILTVPVLLLSEMIKHWLGFEIGFPGDKYAVLL